MLKLETAKEVPVHVTYLPDGPDLQVVGPLLATPLRLAVGAQITVTVNLIWI